MLCHVMPFRLFTKNTHLPFSSRASAGLYTKLLLKLLDNLRVKNFKSTGTKIRGKFVDVEWPSEKVWQRLAASTHDVTHKQPRSKCAK